MAHLATVPRPVLERLRVPVPRRPTVDPTLAGGLRAWLEDEVAGVTAAPSGGTVVVSPDEMAPVGGDPLREALVAAAFRHLVTTGRLDDPMAVASQALALDARSRSCWETLQVLPAVERDRLSAELDQVAGCLRRDWGTPLPAAWHPRTADPVRLPLAGGRVVLVGAADLALGTPSSDRASVCLVQVRAGRPCASDRPRLHHHALLETLRHGAPPFRVATYHAVDGTLVVDDVDDTLVIGALRRVARAVAVAAPAGAAAGGGPGDVPRDPGVLGVAA